MAKIAIHFDCFICMLFHRDWKHNYFHFTAEGVLVVWGNNEDTLNRNSFWSPTLMFYPLTWFSLQYFIIFSGRFYSKHSILGSGTISFCYIIKIEWSHKWFAVVLEIVIKVSTITLSGIYFFFPQTLNETNCLISWAAIPVSWELKCIQVEVKRAILNITGQAHSSLRNDCTTDHVADNPV